MWFLVDNQRNKKLNITLDDKIETLNLSAPNGHAHTTVYLSASSNTAKKYQKQGGRVLIKVQDALNRDFSGEIQLIPETGISIISDIDDTIKISNVLRTQDQITYGS